MAVSRRTFLERSVGASGLLALAPSAPAFLSRAQAAAATATATEKTDDRDTILVVVQLAGGNDGLNTVVPFDDDDYHKERNTLRLHAKDVHRIDDHLGFHPQLKALYGLYRDGLASIVQGVGYPNPNGGHFESMHIWQTADPSTTAGQTGWLGRSLDWAQRDHSPERISGVYVGEIEQPFTLNAPRTIVPHIQTLQDAAALEAESKSLRRLLESSGLPSNGPEPVSLLDYVRRSSVAAADRTEKIAKAKARPTGPYPPIQFAKVLQTVAQLIRADIGVRIYYVELGGVEPGGFDNHAGQAPNHAALLQQLSDSLAAFVLDLKRENLLDRILLMTFSEFGRTVHENGRRGTDHGSAAPMILAGGKLKGGLIGAHPNLHDLENGGQKHHTDFRRVYATVLDQWLGYDSQAILGAKYEPVKFLRG